MHSPSIRRSRIGRRATNDALLLPGFGDGVEFARKGAGKFDLAADEAFVIFFEVVGDKAVICGNAEGPMHAVGTQLPLGVDAFDARAVAKMKRNDGIVSLPPHATSSSPTKAELEAVSSNYGRKEDVMRIAKMISAALGLAFAVVMLAPAAHAGIADQMTKFTFNRPVQIPDHKVLTAGTYWFKTLNNSAYPNTVIIYNKNRMHVEEVLLTTPTYRTKLRNRTEITLAGEAQNRPPMLVKWFYPDSHYGHEFVYSSKTEHRIGEEVATNILANSYSNVG